MSSTTTWEASDRRIFEYQLVDFAEQVADGTVRFAATLLPWLDEHHYTYAMLSDPRVFVRLFSKHLLRASVTISSFHKDLDASLMEQYVDVVDAENDLLAARNDFAEAVSGYRNAILQLRLDTGTLRVDDQGRWDTSETPWMEQFRTGA